MRFGRRCTGPIKTAQESRENLAKFASQNEKWDRKFRESPEQNRGKFWKFRARHGKKFWKFRKRAENSASAVSPTMSDVEPCDEKNRRRSGSRGKNCAPPQKNFAEQRKNFSRTQKNFSRAQKNFGDLRNFVIFVLAREISAKYFRKFILQAF